MLIDRLVIAAYLVGVALIGLYSARKVKTSLNFFISDRNFGKLLMTFFTFGTGTNTDQAVTVASKTYTDGRLAFGTNGCGYFQRRSTGCWLRCFGACGPSRRPTI